MLITVLSQKVARGGIRDGAGATENRWPLLRERIAEHTADLVLLQFSGRLGPAAAICCYKRLVRLTT